MKVSPALLRRMAAALGLIAVTADTPPAPDSTIPPENSAPPPTAITQPAPSSVSGPAAAFPSGAPSAPQPSSPTRRRLQKQSPHADTAAMMQAYRTTQSQRQRQLDKVPDASPSQLAVLHDVARRTNRPLGELIGVAEFESAGTWNNYVHPTLKTGGLGEAEGVFQFMPETFASVVRLYGNKILKMAAADPAKGLPALDLGDENFTDAQVRAVLQRNAGNPKAGGEDLQALRSNFLVASLAKICLDDEVADRTPEGKYANHFLGAEQAKIAMENARNPARRDTLSVKLPPPPPPPPSKKIAPSSSSLPPIDLQGQAEESAPAPVPVSPPQKGSSPQKGTPPARHRGPAGSALASPPAPAPGRAPIHAPVHAPMPSPPLQANPKVGKGPPPVSAKGRRSSSPSAAPVDTPAPAPLSAPGGVAPPSSDPFAPPTAPVTPPPPPPPVDTWGFDPRSAVVLNNRGMFYPKGSDKPYTWGQFLDNLKKQVKAEDSPSLVRAKYGVGFSMNGADTPQWSASPAPSKKAGPAMLSFPSEKGPAVQLPKALAYGPLKEDEQDRYINRLADMVQKGQDQPRATLSPAETTWLTGSLKRQGVLSKGVDPATPVSDPQVVESMRAFRKKVGMSEPDNPAHAAMLTPVLQAALEMYDARITHYAALQQTQAETLAQGLNLKKLKADPVARQAASAQIVALKEGMKDAGVLAPKTQTVVETKTNAKGKPYKVRTKVPQPFDDGIPGDMVARLDAFQLRSGLRPTHGIVDHATLRVLGVAPPVSEGAVVAPATHPGAAVIPAALPVTTPPSSQFNPMAEPEAGVQVALPSPPALPAQYPDSGSPQEEKSAFSQNAPKSTPLRPSALS